MGGGSLADEAIGDVTASISQFFAKNIGKKIKRKILFYLAFFWAKKVGNI